MGKEFKYKCKDFGKYEGCKGEVVISAKVYKLMAERGESLPERCENCKEKNRIGKRETRQAYFHVDLAMDEVVSSFNHCAAAYTSHHDRNRQEVLHEPNLDGMKIRITDEHIKELYEKLDKHQVVILASPTGTGKSVYVLARLLEAPEDYDNDFIEILIRQGQLSQTQPLAEATKRIPNTVSKRLIAESGPGPMATVGFRHSGEEAYSQHNIGIVVTDGSLKNWMRDGHLGQYSLIMVDEAHKRSVNIDSLLTLLQYKLPLYPHLKAIISSATINIEQFQKAFENQGISTAVLDLSLKLEEKINYHVHYWKSGAVKNCDCWLCCDEQLREKFWKKKDMPPEEAELPETVSWFVMEILKNTERGGILAFLTGESVIERTSELIKERIKNDPQLRKVPILPIYSRLGPEEVSWRFDHNPENKRVLLTTDIAETSHTLDDIIYVIESGYIKQYQWDPQDMTSNLPTIRHSRAGCLQRFGRVGRTQKGYVFCLYGKDEFNNQFKKQTTPEIFRSPVDDTLLTVKAAGITEAPSFIGDPDDHIKFNMEIKRSLSSISNGGFADATGNITDEGLDIFRVPLAPHKKALLDLADEQGCLVEMLTFLSMLESDKNDARTGAEIFNLNNGLLVWDQRWTTETKMHVWRIHQALRLGCVDELDFILKLAVCYSDAKKSGKEEQWAVQNFINLPVLENVFLSQKELAEIFLAKAEDREMRAINLGMISKMRLILANVFNGRKVKMKMNEGRLVYQFVGADDGVFGIVPELCVGDWRECDEAFLITAAKKRSILGGQQKLISHACALVRSGSFESAINKDLYFDQKIFVGSKVLITCEKENCFILKVLYSPAQINVDYGEKLDFAVLMDDYLRKGYQPLIKFSNEEAKIKFSEISERARCIWHDERKSSEAKITGWVMQNGIRYAVVTPADERAVIQRIMQENKSKVKIIKVFKGPEDEKGWVLAQTEEGYELPIETADLCFLFLSYGLKQLEGRWLELTVKRFTRNDQPVLSNISRIIGELQLIKQKVDKEGMVELEAMIDRIDINRKIITVFVIDDNGTILTFSAWQKSMLEKFKIGDRVLVKVSLRDERQCYDYQDLEDYQIESLPAEEGWAYDKESSQLVFPCFLDEKKLKYFDSEEEVKERMIKKSWNFGFIARISDVVVEIEKRNTDGSTEV